MKCGWNTELMGGNGYRGSRGRIGNIDRGDLREGLDYWLERFILTVLIPQRYLE